MHIAREAVVFADLQTPGPGGDITCVKCNDDTTGVVLTMIALSEENAETLKEWIEPVAMAGGREIPVTDGRECLQGSGQRNRLDYQVCKSHVKCNAAALIGNLKDTAAQDEDGSLAAIAHLLLEFCSVGVWKPASLWVTLRAWNVDLRRRVIMNEIPPSA